MDRTDSGTSLSSLNRRSSATVIDTESGALPAIDDDEMREMQDAFSHMIDQTCSAGPAAEGNIFEHTYIPQDWYGFFFRSIVPKQETVKQHLEHEMPQQLFQYNDRQGVRYAFKVLDRRTNNLTYEQMPSYHKYGMRLLFTGPVQRELLHTRAIKSFFTRETIRLGKSFDDPQSQKHIPSFVKMYQIDLNELLHPNIADYKTFNEFFYRKLRVGARPIAKRDDPNTIVSAADCRLILFNNIDDATRIWIKGHHFSLQHLFHDDKMAKEFHGGSIAVFRLAPVDYHRFHSPVDGKVGSALKQIVGTYYTVNPIAIKENLDVLTRNRRTVVTIDSDTFDRVAFVAIGALLVGSVNFTVEPGQSIAKGDELGYFAYGGSTIVVVFKAGMVQWDTDLLHNSDNSMETLVRMGEQIGQRTNDQQRQQLLSKPVEASAKHGTIAQLMTHFPVGHSVK